ncbi:MAG TPA: YXWGXW repeat-containing protein [Polyangiaceae bacterium]
MRKLACLVGFVLLSSCGPYLAETSRAAFGFQSPQRCAQGPYEFHTQALGAKWGEHVVFQQEGGGRAVSGTAEIWIDGKKVLNSPVGSGQRDNGACKLQDADRVPVAGGVPAAGGEGGGVPTGIPTAPPPVPGAPPSLVEVPTVVGGQGTYLVGWSISVDDWEKANLVLKAGVDIKIVFWSSEVLDLENVHFVIAQSTYEPSDEAKWIVKLNELKAERVKAQAELDAKNAATNAENARCRSMTKLDQKCRDEGWHFANEQTADERCNALALQNATDAACRNTGWRNANERPDDGASTPPPPSRPMEPQPKEPDGPPPPPQLEAKPPQPSLHAEWVPRSWKWTGFTWAWLSGGWRVPESDRVAKQTPTAPKAPPPSQVDVRPPLPMMGAVWVDGYWHWSNQWVWVPGRWAMPPQAGATWRPTVWIPEGVTVRLDPGGWISH